MVVRLLSFRQNYGFLHIFMNFHETRDWLKLWKIQNDRSVEYLSEPEYFFKTDCLHVATWNFKKNWRIMRNTFVSAME